MSELRIVPCDFDEAAAFVKQHHRHHLPSLSHKFSVAVADDVVRGVAIVGRPVARMLDDGMTLEVYRVATDGVRNGCSALYGACRRAAFALGYTRLITYTLQSEPGTSLHASGWKIIGEAGGGSWSRSDRPRVDKHPLQGKIRWEVATPPGGKEGK